VVSLGFDADGKRIRKKVNGQPKAEVKDKLKALHSDPDAGLRTAQGYAVEKVVADWLDEGLLGADRQDGRGEPGLPSVAADGHRADPAEGPDRAGRAGRAGGAEEDGEHARDPDAAEGA
jgi:hypothetical protein